MQHMRNIYVKIGNIFLKNKGGTIYYEETQQNTRAQALLLALSLVLGMFAPAAVKTTEAKNRTSHIIFICSRERLHERSTQRM